MMLGSPRPAASPLAVPDVTRETARTSVSTIPRALAQVLAAWHLLSLDAPTVAALWVYFLARCSSASVPWTAPAAMFVAVWMLYAADRLLDAHRVLGTGADHAGKETLEERHYFNHRHARTFTTALGGATALLAVLLIHVNAAALGLYSLLGGLLGGWLLLVHLRSGNRTTALPKEWMVGLFFSAAVFVPAVTRAPTQRAVLLPVALLFAGTCSLNCLYIFRWEHPANCSYAHWSTLWAVQRLKALTTMLIGASLATAVLLCRASASNGEHGLSFAALACGLSALSLLHLHRVHRSLRPLTARAAADLCLLTPLLLLPLLSLFERVP